MRVEGANLVRRQAWRLCKALAPALGAKVRTPGEAAALDRLLTLTGSGIQVDWLDLAFGSRHGGRFKVPGTQGVLYAALSQGAARCEAAFNWSKAFRQTSAVAPAGTLLTLQVLKLKISGRFRDVRKGHWPLHDPDSHLASQVFGFQAQEQGWDGVLYRSVRAKPRGTCVAVFRRTAVVAWVEAGQLVLRWDGQVFLPASG